jgi:cytochrome b561
MMGNTTGYDLAKKTIHWLFLVVTILFLITGFGITEFRIVETITLGWLPKSLALRIHNDLWIPFVVLLVLHIFLPFFGRKAAGDAGKEKSRQ